MRDASVAFSLLYSAGRKNICIFAGMIDLTYSHNSCKFLIRSGELRFITPVKLSNKLNGRDMVLKALWDTGAECSVVRSSVAENLGLPTEEVGTIRGVTGEAVTSMSLALAFPGNKSWLTCVLPLVAENPGEGYDFIIGMDIISMGELHITAHKEGSMLEFIYNPECFVDIDKDSYRIAELKIAKVAYRMKKRLNC